MSLKKSFLAGLTGLLFCAPLTADEFKASGYIEGELRYFPTSPIFDQQDSFFGSVAFEPELYWASEDQRNSLTFQPFGRWDSSDGNRTHADIREFFYLYAGDSWQLVAGVNKVFWGVTESAHLVDIVNQTDVVEAFNGEAKLGQPMISVGFEQEWGNLDLYVLPYFRTRRFASGNERYQFSLPVLDEPLPFNYQKTVYESSQRQAHVDYAARWANFYGDFDIAISAFNGTDREAIPILGTVDIVAQVPTELSVYYQQLTQVGLEMQYVWEEWIFKFEGTQKWLGTGNYASFATGFEYTFNESLWGEDWGILVEYLWNNRKSVNILGPSEQATGFPAPEELASQAVIPGEFLSPFENDIFVGTRFALNDAGSTDFVAGFIRDLESHTMTFTFEGSTRIGDSVRLSANVYLLSNVARDSSFFFSRKDDLVELKAAWYF
ncbi:Uncharacterised protein [BD1-7 clade bacterium]|uniref:Alginate export domain-containing protein n=1 Tax=BD1-7 clade bacterium TaxID=2029982 RepID=A0A5S9QZB7_9GAMM|nr:Uncharacterised protein [BD1-7 clade bacterium]